jgi:F0F1-type ATP synthase assembly protein I
LIEPKESKKKKGNRLNTYTRFSGIAFQMVVIIVLGSFGGVKLDEMYPNEYSVFTIIFSLTSVGISMYYVIRQVNHRKEKK